MSPTPTRGPYGAHCRFCKRMALGAYETYAEFKGHLEEDGWTFPAKGDPLCPQHSRQEDATR